MKSIKLTLTVFALSLVLFSSTYAQSDNANVAATATITAAMTLNSTDIAFGEIPTGVSGVMDVAGTVTGGTGGSPATGTLTVPGTVASGTIGLSWTVNSVSGADAILANTGGTTITFAPSLDITAGATATDIGNGASFVHTTATATVIDIYGTLASTTVAGAYSTANTNGFPMVFTATFE